MKRKILVLFLSSIFVSNIFSSVAFANNVLDTKDNSGIQIFNEVSTGSKYHRIPAMYTLSDGTVFSTIDARFGSEADSPNNIDIALMTLKDNNWSLASFPYYFGDYSNESGRASNSASFIDTNIVQGLDNKIHLTVDVFPSGYGYPNAKAGTGYKTINGEKYLALTRDKDTTNFRNFNYYIKDNIIFDDNGNDTGYSVDGYFNLYRNKEQLKVRQKNADGSFTNKEVPMNIFYENSVFKVFPTSYMWTITSNDGGKTWLEPVCLNYLKRENERFMGTGPGRGLTITEGKYKGRILIPIYDSEDGERCSVIYSDDNGKTWNRGNRVTLSEEDSPGKASESQLIQLPDGTVRVYARGSSGYIGYADSFDGGVTFEPLKEDKNLPYGHSGYGCMISVINYSEKIDGKDAIILSSPEGPNRNNGVIRIGLINEYKDSNGKTRYNVDWKYKQTVNDGEFQYSCLTELPNKDIAIMYETAPNGSKSIYKTYTLSELKNVSEQN